ncbi:MAG: hypothetical protein H6747_11190 [Deltaproteobacteria bacterium]|nr:hypothetical protein [Deltaproteobacteria bacterium]
MQAPAIPGTLCAMRPPCCEVCDERFDPREGGALVDFARDPARADWYRRAEDPLFVGHPPHQGWFCATHLDAARALSHQTLGVATRELQLIARLRAIAPWTPGHLRVYCRGGGGADWHHDFVVDPARPADALRDAIAYADDVASEADGEPNLAWVSDGERILARGMHYAERARSQTEESR